MNPLLESLVDFYNTEAERLEALGQPDDMSDFERGVVAGAEAVLAELGRVIVAASQAANVDAELLALTSAPDADN